MGTLGHFLGEPWTIPFKNVFDPLNPRLLDFWLQETQGAVQGAHSPCTFSETPTTTDLLFGDTQAISVIIFDNFEQF